MPATPSGPPPGTPTGPEPRRSPLPSFAGGEVDETRMKASLKMLELLVRRRLDGVLKGDHQGLLPGPGSEPGESRPYTPGDDVRLMDWSVTARTTHPHVRQMIADRELQTWIVVDLSASMDFGSTGGTKRDLAVAASAAVVHLVSGAANRVGCLVTNGAQLVRVQPKSGRAQRQKVLKAIATAPRAVEGTRGIGKADMRLNGATPRIEVDPETYEVRVDGEKVTCEPVDVLPMAQRYFLF